MTDNTKEWLEFTMQEMGVNEINENVIITAMEYIEENEDAVEKELSLCELQDMLCQYE